MTGAAVEQDWHLPSRAQSTKDPESRTRDPRKLHGRDIARASHVEDRARSPRRMDAECRRHYNLCRRCSNSASGRPCDREYITWAHATELLAEKYEATCSRSALTLFGKQEQGWQFSLIAFHVRGTRQATTSEMVRWRSLQRWRLATAGDHWVCMSWRSH